MLDKRYYNMYVQIPLYNCNVDDFVELEHLAFFHPQGHTCHTAFFFPHQ